MKNIAMTAIEVNHHPKNTKYAPAQSSISSINFIPVQLVYFPQFKKNKPTSVNTIATNVIPKKAIVLFDILFFTGVMPTFKFAVAVFKFLSNNEITNELIEYVN